MNAIIAWFQNIYVHHLTKVIGLFQGTVAAVAGYDIIPPTHLKYYLAASAVLTFWRGFFNSAQQEK